MLRIYLAAPLSNGNALDESAQETAVRLAMAAAREVWKAGMAPLCPHLSWFYTWRSEVPYDSWIEMDEVWLAKADAMLRLPGVSRGADHEERFCKEHNIPVFHSLQALRCWAWDQNPTAFASKQWTSEKIADSIVSAPPSNELRAAFTNAMDRSFDFIDREIAGYDPSMLSGTSGLAIKDLESQTKASNPKDAIGSEKAPMHFVPSAVMMEVGLAMLEGAAKYGGHNYRAIGVRASVYYDALIRHIFAFWEGEDVDPDSGLSHITKAISTLVVLRDAMLNGKWVDDRPPKMQNQNWVADLNAEAKRILAKYPNPVAPFTEKGSNQCGS